jgi:hypothetical protein
MLHVVRAKKPELWQFVRAEPKGKLVQQKKGDKQEGSPPGWVTRLHFPILRRNSAGALACNLGLSGQSVKGNKEVGDPAKSIYSNRRLGGGALLWLLSVIFLRYA